jgi:thiol:disulfide interchange protein
MFTLAAIHDVNTGIIMTTITIAYLKSRKMKDIGGYGLLALVIFLLSVFPTPIHGTGIWGIVTLLTTYNFLYRAWDNKEITTLLLIAILLMMVNIALGLKLRGIF